MAVALEAAVETAVMDKLDQQTPVAVVAEAKMALLDLEEQEVLESYL